MTKPLLLSKFSLGVGDRFAHQARAQLQACMQAAERGVQIIPVWNKSNREHLIIGSEPATTRAAADAAVAALHWRKPYHVDADHVRLDTVARFVASSDFFTIDVADSIGHPPPHEAIERFTSRHPELIGELAIEGLNKPLSTDRAQIETVARKYLLAVQEAGKIYRRLVQHKGEGQFITEVSIDETDSPQGPTEVLVILAGLADEQLPVQNIAPKFSGRFNKGVDYVGDLKQFEKEFNDDLAVLAFAVKTYGLPANLKLSVHSGSDKFSIYPVIRAAVTRFNAGLHLKTAGTTWLEELIGLAEAEGDGLALAKEIYSQALDHVQDLCAPYGSVIDINPARLPSRNTVESWDSQQFASALRHDPRNKDYNPHLRQLLHVGYKIAAQLGERYIKTLEACETTVSKNVTFNLFERHIKPVFIG